MKGILRVLLMALALTAPACLPFELSPVDPPDAAANYPPEIVDSSISPRESIIDLRRDTDFQCSVELVVGVVRDEDPDDQLEARWFIDYDFTEGASNALWQRNRLRNPERVVNSFPFNVVDPYATPGLHVVEVVIGESEKFADDQSRRLNPGATVATHRWVVDVPAAARDYCRGAR